MIKLLQFLFVVAIPLVVAGGALVTLFGVGALFDALENQDDLRRRIEALFRQPPKPARVPGRDHFYTPYWSAR